MRIPEHLFDEIKYKERHRLAVKKQLKPKAFSEVFSTVFLWTASRTGFVHIDDIWLDHIEPQILVRIHSSHHPALNSPRAVPPLQAHFKKWSFPDHGDLKGANRCVKDILRRRHTTGRRTSGQAMYKGLKVYAVDLCEEAKKLVNLGLHLNIDTEGEAKFSEEALKIKAEELDKKRKLEEEEPAEDDDSDADDDIPLTERAAAKKATETVRLACP